MKNLERVEAELVDGKYDEYFNLSFRSNSRDRFLELIKKYKEIFSANGDVILVSAPGRTEIGGNHTDHQHGCVLAGSVNLDVIAVAAENNENVIRIKSEGYPIDEISLDDLEPNEKEYGCSSAIIRGMVAKFKQLCYEIKGFNAYTSSNVLKGSGLSSSAAFEVLVGNILNGLFAKEQVSAVEIAKLGQYAENVYFGKPCGLMDQMASSVGGAVFIDFKNPDEPIIKKIDFDLEKEGYALCIIDTGADHADLTDEYAAIPKEMKAVAEYFKKDVLREVVKPDFLAKIPELRKLYGDRAVLRAYHFLRENERAQKEAEVLEKQDFEEFLKLVKQSGYSSYMYLQNVNVTGSVAEQAVGVVLALCEEFLDGKGAYRVHGGGFAGTVQAFVPLDMLDDFKENIEKTVGIGNCHVLSIRPTGGTVIR